MNQINEKNYLVKIRRVLWKMVSFTSFEFIEREDKTLGWNGKTPTKDHEKIIEKPNRSFVLLNKQNPSKNLQKFFQRPLFFFHCVSKEEDSSTFQRSSRCTFGRAELIEGHPKSTAPPRIPDFLFVLLKEENKLKDP